MSTAAESVTFNREEVVAALEQGELPSELLALGELTDAVLDLDLIFVQFEIHMISKYYVRIR